jgi:N-formylglutamate amidohydrolase
MTVDAMQVLDSVTPAEEAASPPFELRRPREGLVTPLIFASPHSGRLYPRSMMAASSLGAEAIRQSEDVLVDDLIAPAAETGAVVLQARFARAYMDVNRGPFELDADMFEDELPPFARARTPRVAAGLGAIARIVAEGQEIYARKLTFAEAQARIDQVHRPYHTALEGLIQQARQRLGLAVLIDWHSMPSAAAGYTNGRRNDMVLGDRFGAACSPKVARLVELSLREAGYRVARNVPYAGGYTTEHYGRPATGVHALQIEIDRGLYLNETTLKPARGYDKVKADLARIFARLAKADWARLA